MTRWLQLCLVLATFASTFAADAVSPEEASRRAEVDKIFAEFTKPGSPGCALAVMKDGTFAYKRGYGLASLEFEVPITTDTQFDIGSTSKQFTATSILLLAADGKLSLDDDIRKYLPEIPSYEKPITIRHMLHHTSGIRDYNEMMLVAGFREADWTTSHDALKLLARQKALNFTPGSEFLYSNSGYFLLAMIVERISGKSMREFAAERIFGPLGMSRTQVFNDHSQVFSRRATGYSPGEAGGFVVNMSDWEQPGDGAVQTTVEDLLKWDQNFYDPKVGGEALIRQLQETGKLADGSPLTYAAGLVIDEYHGRRQVSHGGAWAGYRAQLMRFPTEHLSVTVLCNLSSTDPSALALAVADKYLGAAPQPVTSSPTPPSAPTPTKSAKSRQTTRVDMKPFEGLYWNDRSSLVRHITVVDGKLMYVRGGGRDSELAVAGPDRFQMLGVPVPTEVRFHRDANAHVDGFAVHSDGAPPTTFVAVQPFSPTAAELVAFAGEYYSDEADNSFEIVLDAGQLSLRDKHGDQVAISPVFKDAFTSDGFGTMQFARDANGQIDRFTVSFGRSRGLVFTKLQKAPTPTS